MNQVSIQEKLSTKKTVFKSAEDFHIQTSLLGKKRKKLSPKDVITKYNLRKKESAHTIDILEETKNLAYN